MDALPPTYDAPPVSPITAECVEMVSNHFGLHPDIIFAVLLVESGTVGKETCNNDNGTCDIGPAQINEIHLPQLASVGVTREDLRNNGCVNIATMGWRLSKALEGQPVDTEEKYLSAIARYHSVTPKFNAIYSARLRQAFEMLYEQDETITVNQEPQDDITASYSIFDVVFNPDTR